MRAPGGGDSGAAAGLEDQAAERGVRGALQRNQRGDDRHNGAPFFEWRWRPEIEEAAAAIEIPFPWAVQFGKEVEGIKPFCGTDSGVKPKMGQPIVR
jgi:hypothetical protein